MLNSDVVFWFKGVSYKVRRSEVLTKHYHVKLKTFIKGKSKMVAVRLKENGGCAWNASRIELSASRMHGLPKAKPSILADKTKPSEKRPD